MRVALLASASVIGLLALAGPALADTTFSGVGQLFVGGGATDGSFFAGKTLDDPFIYGGKAKGYWPLSPDVQLQVDLFANQTDNVVKGWSDHDGSMTFGGAAHLLHPFENRARLGVAASVWNTDVFLPAGDGRTDSTYGLFAVEGQFFGTDWTATGQVGIFTTLSCDESFDGCPGVLSDGTFIHGKIRYFLNDNTSLSVATTQMWGNVDDTIFGGKSISQRSQEWSLEGEHKFGDSPYSGAITFSHEFSEATGFLSQNADTNTVLFSLKYYYEKPTLRENDKSGAELETPQFGNAPAISGILADFTAP